jgi:hypothetical protein
MDSMDGMDKMDKMQKILDFGFWIISCELIADWRE